MSHWESIASPGHLPHHPSLGRHVLFCREESEYVWKIHGGSKLWTLLSAEFRPAAAAFGAATADGWSQVAESDRQPDPKLGPQKTLLLGIDRAFLSKQCASCPI